jgi:IclR helix-turn-helix domain
VVARAGVTQRELDEVFGGVEGCFLAAFEESLERLSEVVQEAAGREQRWLGRVRAGLVALLGFFDDEPGWGRLLVLQAPLDAALALDCQRRVQGVLGALVYDGSPDGSPASVELPEAQLTGELVIGGVFSLIRARMLEVSGDVLVELAPSLMAFIVTPYLGQAAAAAELMGRSAGEPVSARVAEIAVRLPVPFHHRTALVLSAIARAPRLSNREIAEAAGLTDKGQTSHLLRRLAQRGLIEKVAPRSGSRRENAWLLTPSGRRVVKLLGSATEAGSSVSAASAGRAA